VQVLEALRVEVAVAVGVQLVVHLIPTLAAQLEKLLP
jgi:hypothetical protein